MEPADTRRSERRAVNGVGVRLSPWSLRSGLEPGCQHGLISRMTPVRIRPPQLDGRVRKSAKRPGREPGERLWVRFPPRLLDGPVVQRRRLLAHIQATMVRVHPGSLWSAGVMAAHLRGKEEVRVQFPGGPLEIWAARQIGKTPASQVGNRGSIPRRSTANRAYGPNGTDTSSAGWRSGFNSRWVHLLPRW